MKLKKIISWLDETLNVKSFSDVSNNGLQIARDGDEIECVAFGVDGSAKFIEEAAKAGAQLAIVHHGISWGGGIKTVTGGMYNVIAKAIRNNVALYGVHLPLDADEAVGHNWSIARALGLEKLESAFVYHGETIGCMGEFSKPMSGKEFLELVKKNISGNTSEWNFDPSLQIRKVGVCSGGAGSFASVAKKLGCDMYLTGEADWGEVISAENEDAPMICAGHYETEIFGIKKLAEKMAEDLGVKTVMTFIQY
jgi:dinuclear metal center YbgI/SA1388 family protein